MEYKKSPMCEVDGCYSTAMRDGRCNFHIHFPNAKGDAQKPICIMEVNENIRRIYAQEPLTRSLKVLNTNCEFRKKYDKFCKIQEGDPNKPHIYSFCIVCKKEFRVHKGNSNTCGSFECKAEAKKRYYREYKNRPHVKEKIREYVHRPHVKEKINERKRKYWRRRYYSNPEVRLKNIEKSRKWRENNKDKIKEYNQKKWVATNLRNSRNVVTSFSFLFYRYENNKI